MEVNVPRNLGLYLGRHVLIRRLGFHDMGKEQNETLHPEHNVNMKVIISMYCSTPCTKSKIYLSCSHIPSIPEDNYLDRSQTRDDIRHFRHSDHRNRYIVLHMYHFGILE